MKSIAGWAYESLLELLFPPACVHCGDSGNLLCAECVDLAQPLDRNICRQCALPMEKPGTCARCAAERPATDRMLATYQMDGPVRSAVHALKYDGIKAIAPVLGSHMVQMDSLDRLEVDLVAPVPLHSSRLRERGFNQAELLARSVSHSKGWQLDSGVLERKRSTPPQVEAPNETERAASMRDAFKSPRDLAGERVLLIDDVVTTASTVNSAAAALKRAGASRVTVLALAREL